MTPALWRTNAARSLLGSYVRYRELQISFSGSSNRSAAKTAMAFMGPKRNPGVAA